MPSNQRTLRLKVLSSFASEISAPSRTVLPAKELPCLTSWARPASCRADVRVKRSADGVYQSVSASCVQTLCVV